MKTCWFHLMPYRFLPENFERGQLADCVQKLRVGHLMVLLQIGSMPKELVFKNTELFGKEVLPYMRDTWKGYEDEADRANPPAYAEQFARLIRAAAVRSLPGGHMLHLESPDAVADPAAKFLSS